MTTTVHETSTRVPAHERASAATASAIDSASELSDGESVATPDDPPRGPVWRVVGGSLLTGFLGSVVLTLGVFAGAREHVITGSALLAFALGWAMLAVLSTRFTSQPQRWALVPAAFMAIAGTGLLVSSPGDQALRTVGWVWPPALLALAVWATIQTRRCLAGRVRLLVYPVLGALTLGSVGGMYETVALVRDAHDYPAPGVLYDVGGHRLHLDCSGSGSPTVVLENGLGGTSVLWSRITAAVSPTTRVCAYDRAGQGWSDDAAGPRDAVTIAAELHTLLDLAGEAGPYVLIGHSAGGNYVMTYAARHPDDVAGMVLLDSMTPHQFTALPDFATEYSMMRRVLGVLPSLARLGIAQVLPASAYSSLPEPAASQMRAFATSPRHMRNMRDEQSVYRDVFEQAGALIDLDGKPLVVVTATESGQEIKGWSEEQVRLATLSTNSERRVVEATHEGVLDHQQSFEGSVDAIEDVVQSVRTGRAVLAG